LGEKLQTRKVFGLIYIWVWYNPESALDFVMKLSYSIKVKALVPKSRYFKDVILLYFNPESALDFVTKLNYSIKAGAHGLFLKMEYFCILNLKIGESSEAYLEFQCKI
jgi:hypothetical protein